MNITEVSENPTDDEVVDSFLLKEFLDTYITTRNLEFIEEGVKFYLYTIHENGYTHHTITFTGNQGSRLLINVLTLHIKQNNYDKSCAINFKNMENPTNRNLIVVLDKYDEFAKYRSSNGRPTSYQFTSTEKLIEFLVDIEPYI